MREKTRANIDNMDEMKLTFTSMLITLEQYKKRNRMLESRNTLWWRKKDHSLYHNKYYIEQSTFTHLANSLNRFENQFEEKVCQGMPYSYTEDKVQYK